MAEDKSSIDFNLLARIKRQVVLDDDLPNQLRVAWSQDVTDVIDENAQLEDVHSQPGSDLRLAARIPIAEWLELQRNGIADDPVALKKWLNDPDRKKYRVWKGRL